MQFTYQAMTSDGNTLTDRLEAGSSAEAADTLRNKGLTVLQLEAARGRDRATRPPLVKSGWRGVGTGDLVLFTRQMKMLLEAGAALVPALQAIEEQTAKPSFAQLVQQIREDVERGGSLSEAFRERPDVFKPVFCSMIAAGEATASLPGSFHRLSELALRQQQARKRVIGALVYPAILSVLCIAVASVVLGFVVPRFTELFHNLNSPLPTVTRVLFAVSQRALDYWWLGAGGLAVAVISLLAAVKLPHIRRRFDTLFLKLPVIGRIGSRLIFARVLRVWAAMLRCHVPLLEAIQHSRSALTNTVFITLVREVEDAVSSGGSVGRTLAESGLVEPVVASAIRTGEENGRLPEAVEFVSEWMDDDNSQLIAGLTRAAEPALLTVMGLFVGLVAMSLFIPLFDLATAGA